MRPGTLSREEQPSRTREEGRRGCQTKRDSGKGLGAKGRHDEKGRSTCLCEQWWDGSLWAPTIIPSLCQAPTAKNSSWLCSLDLPDDGFFPPSCWQSCHRPPAALLVVGAQEMFVELRGSHSLCGVWIIH